jgi:phage shock protein PspC (stress-responsive transcriptional regulator)
MQRVVTINLNGAVYQLDENAYQELRDYLDEARARLESNLDRGEIIGDLEQAIGDRCARVLGPGKAVVAKTEIDRILSEIGPVEAGANGESRSASGSRSDGQPKRLYQIREGAMLSGVCNGIGAYLNIDPTIIRIAFVALTFFTGGAWIAAYLLLMFLIPYAKTSDQLAAAQGPSEGLPYRIQEVVEKIKGKLTGVPFRWRKRTS